MAQFRQSGGERASGRVNGSNGAEQISSLSVRSAYKQGRIRRSGRSDTCRKVFVGASVLFISMILIATVFFLNLLSDEKAYNNDNYQHDGKNNSQASLSSQSRRKVFRVLKFGKGSFALGRDSRYWDKDDRRRDGRYTESSAAKVGDHDGMKGRNGRSGSKQFPSGDAIGESNNKQGDNRRSRGLYNEAGRDELKHYEAEYEASMKHSEKLIGKNEQHGVSHTANDSQTERLDFESEFDGDDGLDYHDAPMKNSGITRHDDLGNSDNHIGPFRNSSFLSKSKVTGEIFSKTLKKSSFLLPETIASQKSESKSDNTIDRRSTKTSLPDKKLDLRKGIRRHKFSGLSCEIKFANYSAQLVEPLENRKFSRFTLQYTEVENRPNASEGWEPRFSGHQSLQEREESFYAHDQMINCGFVRSSNESLSTGFDLAEDDVRFMSSCHIVVSSCIFGNSDRLRTPTNKVSRFSRKNVCFVMFMEESTLQMLSSEGQKPDRMGFIGLWKIVVVKNLPYTDMRRVGKIPKLLAHRLFPSARYSIWLDSKLRLQSDPLLILEYFLWRRGYEYAISNHYDRHCVWEEVMQNKRLNKYNHSIIDQQFKFYQADGLKRFDQSDPKKLLPSYVPEGSFIVRAHTPMSNLFSCLWFNEVDRFTPRDQLSFGYTYLKLRRMNPGKPFYLNMFKDCERRSIVKLFRHRAEEKRNVPFTINEMKWPSVEETFLS